MEILKKFVVNSYFQGSIKKRFLLFLFYVLLGEVFIIASCSSCFETATIFKRASIISISLWVILANANHYATAVLDEFMSWKQNQGFKFFVAILMTVLISPSLYYFMMRFWEGVYNINLLGSDPQDNIVFAVIVSVAISGVLHGRGFIREWKIEAVRSEKLQKENAEAKYETLKNQINPHFLFNNLNVLTNLIHLDQDKAGRFVKQLSDVYRYILEHREKDLIPVKEELKFLESYFFLLKTRFRNGFTFVSHLKNPESILIPPLVLQILIENAVKHNVVAEETPLNISIEEDETFIIVQNNLQIKQLLRQEYTGVGLQNIIQRYQHLADQAVEIINDGTFFTIKLPKLK